MTTDSIDIDELVRRANEGDGRALSTLFDRFLQILPEDRRRAEFRRVCKLAF